MPDAAELVPTGIAIYINNPNYAGIILPRSGLGHKGIILGNTIGLIDSDYQGQIFISCWNRGKHAFTIKSGDRIAQMVIIPITKVNFEMVSVFTTISERNEKGFGHTGIT